VLLLRFAHSACNFIADAFSIGPRYAGVHRFIRFQKANQACSNFREDASMLATTTWTTLRCKL
jgi:hypothetical protein